MGGAEPMAGLLRPMVEMVRSVPPRAQPRRSSACGLKWGSTPWSFSSSFCVGCRKRHVRTIVAVGAVPMAPSWFSA